jgi:hypothetical protein
MDDRGAQQGSDIWKTRIWQIGAIFASLLSGGAMGAFINHYYSTRQTVVSYSVNTTSLGAGEATKSVLPTLKLQLDNTEIPAVYTHTIELTLSSGPELDQASVGITLAGAKLYGSPVASGPDALHQITCKYEQTIHTVVCSIGRISSKSNPYRIILATDQASQITVAIDGKNTEIEAVQHPKPEDIDAIFWRSFIATIPLIIAMAVMMFVFQRRILRRYSR